MTLRRREAFIVLVAGFLIAGDAWAGTPALVRINVKGHKFRPPEVHAPANVPIILRIANHDPLAMEFESVSLRVEKVIDGKKVGTIRLRPLSPGRYDFFDDLSATANGELVVR